MNASIMSLNYTNSKLRDLIVHFVGNKLSDEGIVLSETCVEIQSKESQATLTNFFLSPFNQLELFTFWHESDIKLNAAYSYVKDIFTNRKTFVKNSKNLARHFYEQSSHPKIKSGELYISFFDNCIFNDELVEVIGIFKAESKDRFIKTYRTKEHLNIEIQEGTNTTKPEKGCLIISSQEKEELQLLIIDNASRSNDAQYWKDNFLKAKPISDDYHNTKDFLTLTRQFISNQFPQEYAVDKIDQIDLLNKSVQFFKYYDEFDLKAFEKEVLKDREIIKSFREFGQSFTEKRGVQIAESFRITDSVVKKQARALKSVLKLDKNFHIYIHGPRELIEHGVDRDGKKYYKIYYDEES